MTRPEPPSDVGKFRYLSIGAPGTASAITMQVGSNFAGINISDGSATKTIWVEGGRVIDRSLPEEAISVLPVSPESIIQRTINGFKAPESNDNETVAR